MSITQIDLDDDELEQAMRNLGTATKKDTVNSALREVNARRRRLAALERMVERYESGEFDAAEAAWERRKAADAEPGAPAA
jgi:Arc/MetJ family transcription regulator